MSAALYVVSGGGCWQSSSVIFGRRRSEETPANALRPLLFGDAPLRDWPPHSRQEPSGPWADFALARERELTGRHEVAVAIWQRLAATSELESRHVLQAWHFLRAAGVQPDETVASTVLGAVAEVSVDDQHDLLVAYRDGGVRYLNWSGSAAVLEPGNNADVDLRVAEWLAIADRLALIIGVWEEPELPGLPAGHSRILLLTPAGKRFGQGPHDLLLQDPSAAAYLGAATHVLLGVTEASNRPD